MYGGGAEGMTKARSSSPIVVESRWGAEGEKESLGSEEVKSDDVD